MFCLDASLIGTEKHLFCREDGISWVDEVPAQTWHLSGHLKNTDWCLDTLLKLNNITIDMQPPQQYVNMMKSIKSRTTPWSKVMPSAAFRRHLEDLVALVGKTLPALNTSYFYTVWRAGNSLINSLQRANIDLDALEKHLNEDEVYAHMLKSFIPNDDGFATLVHYNRFNTITGRLTVDDGPRILTLKKTFRDVIAPSTVDGKIMMVDFAALEARILLYENGNSCDDIDLYGKLAQNFGYSRKAVKGAVISKLYGSSKHALGNALGIFNDELDTFIAKVDSQFDTRQLLSRLKSQFYKTGYIQNRHGRQILIDEPVDNIFISYYGQSTGVDVTMLGFNLLVKALKKVAPNVRPLFLLHDAIVLDVPKESIEIVNSVKTLKISGYDQQFIVIPQVLEQNVKS
jgi:hypothetical protein